MIAHQGEWPVGGLQCYNLYLMNWQQCIFGDLATNCSWQLAERKMIARQGELPVGKVGC